MKKNFGTSKSALSQRDKSSQIELELWLERNLRERARNSKKGSEERIRVFVELLEKVADNDEVFGALIRKSLSEFLMKKDSVPSEVQALQRVITQEKRLAQLKEELDLVEKENEALKKQQNELVHHINRRQDEVNNLEASIRLQSSMFSKQRELNDEMSSLFKHLDEPIIVKSEIVETEAPQIISLRNHNENLRQQIYAIQKCIEVAQDEINMIQKLK